MNTIEHNIGMIRERFPALARHRDGVPFVYLDGPAGTQVPKSVADTISHYLLWCNANHGGLFQTSLESDRWLNHAHSALAAFVGADDPDEIVFGQNMTSLTFALSRALGKSWAPGDEIIVTRLDHDANITPWVLAAKDAGVTVRYVDFDPTDHSISMESYRSVLSPRTRFVAIGAASNATGGINPVKELTKLAHEQGAIVFVDAVHFGPHGLIDVKAWDCDFLACSSYKFFGPHLGILWGRRNLLQQLVAYKVRPASNEIPGKWMSGTQSHEAIAGAWACVQYLADLHHQEFQPDLMPSLDDEPQPQLLRENLLKSFALIVEYEQSLSRHFLETVAQVDGIQIYGITNLDNLDRRFPTFSLTHPGIATSELARLLSQRQIFVWNGNYYALQFTESLDLEPEGMIRVGLVHYNTHQEIDRLAEALKDLLVQAAS